ncbi:MAG: hypothetical protein AAF547_14495 [Actinomycetota bacterium]
MTRSRLTVPLLVIGIAVLASACAPGSDTYASDQAGFFSGIWHGWIAPISLILHFLVDDAIRIYEANNTGIWYDVGFYMAIISGFGSLGLTRRSRNRGRRRSHRSEPS